MNDFRGRRRELGILRSLLDRPEPVLVRLFGPAGVGKTALLQRALVDYDCVHHTVPPLPETAQRRAFARELGLEPAHEPPSWKALFDRFDEDRTGGARPRILVLDDAHRLFDARSRVVGPLVRWLHDRNAGRSGPPRHAVLSGRLWDELDIGSTNHVTEQPLRLRPLTLRAARPFLPGVNPSDKIVSYAVFGGVPRRLRLLDPAGSPGTNLRRLVLDRDGPLARAGIEGLETELQTPSRYAAILSALAPGEGDWATVHGSVPEVTRGGQVAPYLKTLERIGLVEVSRSLDARPDSRNRRYRVVDGFDAFWFRHILPHLGSIEMGSGPELLAAVRAGLDRHTASVFPTVCRQYLTHDATERLPANARECGGLWGAGYDLPVAGLFTSGGAFYGMPSWSSQPTPALLDELDHQIRETRYGFGREGRMRILFGRGPFTLELERRAARRHDTALIDAEALIGNGS